MPLPTAPRAIQTFEVSLKAFIVREGRALLLREADTGYWELPGGRIDVGEERVPHAAILAREIAEELGPKFHVEPTAGTVTWVRQRPTDHVFQVLIACVCTHRSGDPQLSPEHDDFVWATPAASAMLSFPPLSDYPDALARLWATAR
jgi:8-oxo-dGTP pyrophosphatase MutT (NUDIX family)